MATEATGTCEGCPGCEDAMEAEPILLIDADDAHDDVCNNIDDPRAAPLRESTGTGTGTGTDAAELRAARTQIGHRASAKIPLTASRPFNKNPPFKAPARS